MLHVGRPWSSLGSLLFAATLVFSAACTGTSSTPTAAPTTAKPAATTAPATSASAAPAAVSSPAATSASPVVQPAGSPAAVAASPATAASPAVAAASPSAAAAAPLGTPAAGLQHIGGTVTVLGTWGGSEQDSFMAMVKPFEDATGVQVQYEGTRDLNAVLTTRVQGNNPPDLAGLPGPGQMAEFAQQGKLVDLSTILDPSYRTDYSSDWIKLGTANNQLVGIFIKAALKGPIWYNTKTFPQVSGGTTPKTWDEMMALSQKIAATGTTPWCIGLENGAASGWPGTDWLEDIMLRSAGPDVYDQWWQGKLAWTSPQVKNTWQQWGKIVGDPSMVYGGKQGMLATAFGDAGNPMFANPPKCYMHHQGSFITDFFVNGTPGIKPVTDFNFFPFPDIDPQYAGAVEAAGDLFGMFKDTPQSRALIKYLTTPEAQAIWVQRGGALSPNQRVPLSTYPDELSREQAQTLTTAKIVRFDASDLMPDAMQQAFLKSILDFVQNPGNLDSILGQLDSVRQDAYKS